MKGLVPLRWPAFGCDSLVASLGAPADLGLHARTLEAPMSKPVRVVNKSSKRR